MLIIHALSQILQHIHEWSQEIQLIVSICYFKEEPFSKVFYFRWIEFLPNESEEHVKVIIGKTVNVRVKLSFFESIFIENLKHCFLNQQQFVLRLREVFEVDWETILDWILNWFNGSFKHLDIQSWGFQFVVLLFNFWSNRGMSEYFLQIKTSVYLSSHLHGFISHNSHTVRY
jgi:hypothetical protein